MSSPVRGHLLGLMEAFGIAKALNLSSLEMHMISAAAVAAQTDLTSYLRQAIRERLERETGAEYVARRWTP